MARILIIAIWIPFFPIFFAFLTSFSRSARSVPTPDLDTFYTRFFLLLEHLVRPPMEVTPPPPPRVTLEAEWAGMPSEWKFFLHSWIFEVHSKYSDCTLSAFQIFGPILVAGPECFYHAKIIRGAFEVENYQTAFEVYSNCTLTAF